MESLSNRSLTLDGLFQSFTPRTLIESIHFARISISKILIIVVLILLLSDIGSCCGGVVHNEVGKRAALFFNNSGNFNHFNWSIAWIHIEILRI